MGGKRFGMRMIIHLKGPLAKLALRHVFTATAVPLPDVVTAAYIGLNVVANALGPMYDK